MSHQQLTVLVVGATGSIGRLVVEEAGRKAHGVRALARDPRKAGRLFPDAEVVAGDLTAPDTLAQAVVGVDAIVLRTALTAVEKPQLSMSTTEACGLCSPPSAGGRCASR